MLRHQHYCFLTGTTGIPLRGGRSNKKVTLDKYNLRYQSLSRIARRVGFGSEREPSLYYPRDSQVGHIHRLVHLLQSVSRCVFVACINIHVLLRKLSNLHQGTTFQR